MRQGASLAPGDHRRLGRVMLGTQLYDQLRADIIRGVIEPGEKLLEVDVANRFGVSRTPAREALRRLEAEGLVLRDGAGLAAAWFSLEAGSEVLLIRQLLEPTCGETSAAALTRLELGRLDAIVIEMQSAGAEATKEEHAELNNRFHDALYARCPYPRLLEEVRRIREHYVTYWLYATYTVVDAQRVVVEHRAMARLARRIADGDSPPEALRVALDSHIGDARRRFEDNVRSAGREGTPA